MTTSVLDRFLSEEFQASLCPYSTAPSLRLFLVHRPEVTEVRKGLEGGTLSEQAVRDFLAQLLAELRPGVHFSHDGTLAAVAVACEQLKGSFTDSLLTELASLEVSEIPLAPRVARDILQRRSLSPVGAGWIDQGTGRVEAGLPSEPAHPGA